MIVWLASYPRSGNTLVRQMIKQMFGLETHSRYNDSGDIGAQPEVAKAVGHANFEGGWDDFYEQARQSAKITFVKTHDPPIDTGRAIYIVRDGRAAMVSFLHLQREFRRRDDIDLPKVMKGEVPFGSWSQHLSDWNPLERPDTLLLRFEDLVGDPRQSADRIGDFIGIKPTATWSNELDKLRALLPGFFRQGSDAANFEELSGDAEDLFWNLHGPWMQRMGYLRG